MLYFKSVLLVLSCVSLVMCIDHRAAAWKRHNRLVSEKNFPCKEPQPRVFYLEELIGENEWRDKYEAVKDKIRPTATVLYRCESAGCCSEWNQRCQPTKTQNVTLTYGIVHRKIKYFSIEQKNHTECACQEMHDNSIKK